MPSKTIAYLRVSTGGQDLDHQKLAILEYARRHRTPVADFVAVHGAAGSRAQREQLLGLIDTLQPGDRLIVSELSRLGRSLPQILQIVERLMHKDIRLVALKESIRFEGKHNVQTKAMIALFGLFAEVERDLIAERTKEGLAAAKAKGRRLGRPKGALGKSKLDGKEAEITLLLQKKGLQSILGITTGEKVGQNHRFKNEPRRQVGALVPCCRWKNDKKWRLGAMLGMDCPPSLQLYAVAGVRLTFCDSCSLPGSRPPSCARAGRRSP